MWLCDSTVTTITTLSSGDNITLNETTCDVNNVGTVVQNLVNAASCDSIVTTITTLDVLSGTITAIGDVLTAHPSGLTYQWLDCSNNDVAIAGETNDTYTVTSNGDYAVVISDIDCSDTTNCYTVSDVGIGGSEVTTFRIYPNPTTSSVNIEFASIGNRSVELTNTLGQVVFVIETKESNKWVLDLSSLSNGVYYVRVTDNKKTNTQKLILKN